MTQFEFVHVSSIEIPDEDVEMMKALFRNWDAVRHYNHFGVYGPRITLIKWVRTKYDLELRQAKDIVDKIHNEAHEELRQPSEGASLSALTKAQLNQDPD